MPKSISDLIMEYFCMHPNQDLKHGPIVDWVTEQYLKDNPEPPRDVWRGIRKLHQEGKLIKVKKGVHRYDPNYGKKVELFDFSSTVKKAIFKRDSYKCVICGRGIKNGVELHVDHIKPKDLGGKATIENGQTLCSQHNFIKKNLKQTETGKKMFIRLYELAKSENSKELMKFSADVLETYEKHNINGHIVWKK
ncbi:MAG: HNH endonuclease [Candidatus Firestonebacteria bacterium]|nr:HNH endonuclease [Candidatus Firestonebacteria bacterium]